MERPRSIAMPWYGPADYARLRDAAADRDRLPDRYDLWRLSAEQVEGEVVRSGVAVVRVFLDPDAFAGWCRDNALSPNATARSRYANETAERRATDRPPAGGGQADGGQADGGAAPAT